MANAFLVEGAKFVAEIGSDWEILHIVMSQSYAVTHHTNDAIVVADKIFASLSDVASPQGILAVVAQRDFPIEAVLGSASVFLLDDINDPGNLGTILRNCHGLGVGGVVLSPNCTDIYNPKVIRASAGSIFHIPFVTMGLYEAIKILQGKNTVIYATAADGEKAIYELDLCQPSAFVMGNEHHGVSQKIMGSADQTVKIPTASESLNVSVACAIIGYETLRQRKIGGKIYESTSEN